VRRLCEVESIGSQHVSASLITTATIWIMVLNLTISFGSFCRKINCLKDFE
jgi:hypothetical protein